MRHGPPDAQPGKEWRRELIKLEEDALGCTPVLTRKAQSLTFGNHQNQAALKTIRRADTPANQERIKHILDAIERLATRRVLVQLRWLPGHRGVEGNELADKTAREITEQGTRETTPIRYLSAVNNQQSRSFN